MLVHFAFRPVLPQVEEEEAGAYGDRAVGGVEAGEFVGAEEDLQEIGDGAAEEAVVHISGGASENQRQGYFEHRGLFDGLAEQHRPDDRHNGQRHAYQEQAAPFAVRLRQESERGAGIFRVDNVEEAGDDRFGIPRREIVLDVELGDAVENHHACDDRDGTEAGVHSDSVMPISVKAARHGSQTCAPSRAMYFQQRSHLKAAALATASCSPNSTAETTKRAGRLAKYSSSSGSRFKVSLASSGAPISFSCRAVSSILRTPSRTAIRRSHFSSAASSNPPASSSGSGRCAK